MPKALAALLVALFGALFLAAPALAQPALQVATPGAADRSNLAPNTSWIGANTVTSFQGRQGAVTLNLGDLSPLLLNGAVASGHMAIFNGTAGQISDGGAPVNSVGGNTGAVTAAQLAAALNAQPITLGAGSTAPTQALGDNTTKLATDAFVRANGAALSWASVTANTTLTTSAIAEYILDNASGPITVTLPAASTVYAGAPIAFYNNGGWPETIAPNGTDGIDANGSGASIVLPPAGTRVLYSNGANAWKTGARFDNGGYLPVEAFGASPLATIGAAHLTIGAGSTTLTSDVSLFAAAQVGRAIVVPWAGPVVGAPAAPSLSIGTVPGTLTNPSTVYVEVTYVTPSGETTPSPEASVAVSASAATVEVAPPPPSTTPYAYNVYAAYSSGAEVKQNATPVPIRVPFDISAIGGAGAPPATNGAGATPLVTTVSGYTSGTQITLGAAAGSSISAQYESIAMGTDSGAAINACLTAAAASFGTCLARNASTTGAYAGYYIGTSVAVLAGTALVGIGEVENNYSPTAGEVPTLLIAPGATVDVAGELRGMFILAAGTPTVCGADVQCQLRGMLGQSGTGVTLTGAAGIDRNVIGGFADCIDAAGQGHWHIVDNRGDCSTVLTISNMHDWSFVRGLMGKWLWNGATNVNSASVKAVANNGSGAMRLTVSSTAPFATGNVAAVSLLGGLPSATARWPIAVIDSTHLDLTGSTYVAGYTSGGVVQLVQNRPGALVVVADSEGPFIGGSAQFGWDTCAHLSHGAAWAVLLGVSCDSFADGPDRSIQGFWIDQTAVGTLVINGYVSSTYRPIMVSTVNSGTNYSSHQFIGGRYYTMALDQGLEPSYGQYSTLQVKSGHVVLSGVEIGTNLIEVDTGASLALSGCYDGGSGTDTQITAVPTMRWFGGSDLSKVDIAACRIGVPLSGSVLNPPTVFVTAPASGATQTAGINTLAMVLENTTTLATQTIKLPPITGDFAQAFQVSSIGGVTTATFQTSTGGAITNAPTTLGALSPRKFASDGTNWHPVQ